MINKIKSFSQLARLDKPIGIFLLLWPTMLGFLLAGTVSEINLKNLLIVISGSILVRSCGCVINDITDYKIDKLVTRTIGRPLAIGSITLIEAWIFFLMLGAASVALLIFTNPFTIKLSILFACLIIFYPLTKRFFPAPQFVLGITFGSGSLIAYSLQSSSFSWSLALLYIGIVAWIISFDTFYALEDKEDDLKINVNSTAILWGNKAIKYAQILHLFFYLCLFIVAVLSDFSSYFFITLGMLAILFFYQNSLIKDSKFLNAFKINNWVGIVAVTSFFFEIVYLN